MAWLRCGPVESGSLSPQPHNKVRLSQDSILDFLAGTGLPLVSGIGRGLRLTAVGLALLCGGYGLFALLFLPQGLWDPALPWAGALPSLLALPALVASARLAKSRRLQASATALCVALLVLVVFNSWVRGAFYPGWYLLPVLTLLAACGLGARVGMALTVSAMVAMLLAVSSDGQDSLLAEPAWVHSVSLAGLMFASALTGLLAHQLLRAALESAEWRRLQTRQRTIELRERERMLRHAMRVDTVGDLSGLVAHQLRNVFQVMIGHVTLGTLPDSEDAEQRLRGIGDLLRQSSPLLDQLMSLAHPEDGPVVQCDLAPFVTEFLGKVRMVLPATIEVESDISGAGHAVSVDLRGLEHALWNLVINARHAMEERGRIAVNVVRTATEVLIEVADNGSGIPAHVRERIFDPYFTTKPLGKGTGLGLAAVDQFVRTAGGRVELESVVGEGTTFRLRFAAAEPATVADVELDAG